MRMKLLACCSVVMVWWATVMPCAAAAPQAAIDVRHRQLLEVHCQRCHGAETQESGVRVDDLPLTIDTIAAAERWQKVLNVLNSGDMPPKEELQPERAAKADFLDDLATAMVTARKLLADQGGRITMRRPTPGNTCESRPKRPSPGSRMRTQDCRPTSRRRGIGS